MKFTMNTIIIKNITMILNIALYTCYIVVKYSINKNNNPLVTIISLLFVLLQIVR